jgi:hypothetical protein
MRKLPVVSAVRHAFSTVRNNLDVAFKLIWPWALMMLVVNWLSGYAVLSTQNTATETTDPSIGQATLDLLSGLIVMVGFSSIAVNWHRYVLLNEIPSAMKILRIDWLIWRYLGNSLLAALIVMIPGMFAIFTVRSIVGISNEETFNLYQLVEFYGLGWKTFPLLLLNILISIFVYRLFVKLPAIALERANYKFLDAWTDTKSNMLGFVLLSVVSTFVLIVPENLVAYALQSSDFAQTVIGMSARVLLNIILQCAVLIVSVSALTSLYSFFAEKRDF